MGIGISSDGSAATQMKFETPIDRRIFKTIQGRTSSDPQTLLGIIGGVDASERMVLTHDELSSGLKRLVSAGHIAEIEPHRFYDASNVESPSTFSDLTESDHAKAVRESCEMCRRHLDKLDDEPGDDDFVWQKLALRWATPDGRWPTDEDEDRVEELAKLMDPIITQSGLGEINGFEYGSGQIDVLIFGKATDSDVDQIYELVAPTFRIQVSGRVAYHPVLSRRGHRDRIGCRTHRE
jgi:hypothetical protein